MNTIIKQLCNANINLVAIPPINGKPTKAPQTQGWNKPKSPANPNGYSNNYEDFITCKDFNFGLFHGASNTLAFDIDNMTLTSQVLAEVADIQLNDWLTDDTRLEIKSPKPGRGKLIFNIPPKQEIKLRQFKHDKEMIFELRCGNCQDVISGQHPEGGNYQIIGNLENIPPIPDILMDMVQHWDDWKPCLNDALSTEDKMIYKAPKAQNEKPKPIGWRDPIKEFNQSFSLQEILLRNGYTQMGKNRFLRPNSTSKAPAVAIMNNCTDGIERAFSHGGDALNDSYAHDAFDCYRLLECNGEW